MSHLYIILFRFCPRLVSLHINLLQYTPAPVIRKEVKNLPDQAKFSPDRKKNEADRFKDETSFFPDRISEQFFSRIEYLRPFYFRITFDTCFPDRY